MPVKFLVDRPIAFIPEEKTIVISDLQIGFEQDLYRKGVTIRPQAEKFLKVLDEVISSTKTKTVVITGDLKHGVPGITLREMKEIPKFFLGLLGKANVIFCRGNHDTGLEGFIPEGVKVYGSGGVKIGKYGFFHGHAWPGEDLMSCDYLFMGHLQPGIEFKDEFGLRMIEQVWVRSKLDREKIMERYKIKRAGKLNIVVVPAFNPLLGCAVINLMSSGDYLGPLFRDGTFNLDDSQIFLLDGTLLGKLKNIKQLAQ